MHALCLRPRSQGGVNWNEGIEKAGKVFTNLLEPLMLRLGYRKAQTKRGRIDVESPAMKKRMKMDS